MVTGTPYDEIRRILIHNDQKYIKSKHTTMIENILKVNIPRNFSEFSILITSVL